MHIHQLILPIKCDGHDVIDSMFKKLVISRGFCLCRITKRNSIPAAICVSRICLQNYKKRPAEFLEEMGILGPNLLTAHNVMLSDHDIALMAERGVKMIHCPRANLSNHGFPKAPQILEAGASLGLGCDGAAPSNLDIFDEMKVLRYAMMAYWGLPSFNPAM